MQDFNIKIYKIIKIECYCIPVIFITNVKKVLFITTVKYSVILSGYYWRGVSDEGLLFRAWCKTI